MTTKKSNSQARFIRYIKAPFRALSKLRDIYIHSMISCAGHASYGGSSSMGCPAPYGLPKSFSVNSIRSSNDDYSELIRAASTRTLGRKMEAGIVRQQQKSYAAAPIVKRSQTVGIGRIDEDKTCDFGDDFFYIRSRSYAAVTKRPNFYYEAEAMTPLVNDAL